MRTLGLTGPGRSTPEGVVGHLLAVQAQDHAPALWSVGQRLEHPCLATVDAAFEQGRFVRLHVLRTTWHLVVAADVRWLAEITAPRLAQVSAGPYRQLDLTPALLDRCRQVVEEALAERAPQTRAELGSALGAAGIEATGRRLAYVMMHAELSGLVCSGPLKGKQHTYALVSERAPDAVRLTREEALRELVGRYAASHGPVTAHDLGTWATLTVSQARQALEAAELVPVDVEGTTHWHQPDQELPGRDTRERWHLLQTYDELVVGYRHSGHVLGPESSTLAQRRRQPQGVVLLDGHLAGRWRRRISPDRVTVEILLHVDPDARQRSALDAEVARYATFLDRQAVIRLL